MQFACKNACLFCLFICLFMGKIWYPILHTYYTKLPFFPYFSDISGISGTSRHGSPMGENPWMRGLNGLSLVALVYLKSRQLSVHYPKLMAEICNFRPDNLCPREELSSPSIV